MDKKKQRYTIMAGRTIISLNASTLWQGKDHLLYVHSIFLKERYKRFYFSDIQSILMRRTKMHWVLSIIWGCLTLIFGLMTFPYGGLSSPISLFFGICLMALIVNLVMGPTCSVYLQTAVQLEKLACLRRVRSTHKVMARIKLLVEEVQGTWRNQKNVETDKVVLHNAANTTAWSQQTPHKQSVDTEKDEHQPKEPYHTVLHRVLFALLLSMGMIGAMQVLLKNRLLGLLGLALYTAAFVIGIIALVRWFRHMQGTLIAKLNGLALIFIAVQTVIGCGNYVVASFRNPDIYPFSWRMFEMMFASKMDDHPLAIAVHIMFSVVFMLMGAFGLLSVQRNRPVVSEDQPTCSL